MKKRITNKKIATKRAKRTTYSNANSNSRRATGKTTTCTKNKAKLNWTFVPVEIRTHNDARGGHPHIIVDAVDNKHVSVGLTHDKYKGKGHKNIALQVNPLGKQETSYMHRQGTVDSKRNYSKRPQKGVLTKPDSVKASLIGAKAKQKYLSTKTTKTDKKA